MKLEEYLWRTRKSYRDFSQEADICYQGLPQYVNKSHSPGLLNTLKIYVASDGNVPMVELLSNSDIAKLQDFLISLRAKKMSQQDYSLSIINELEAQIAESKKDRSILDQKK